MFLLICLHLLPCLWVERLTLNNTFCFMTWKNNEGWCFPISIIEKPNIIRPWKEESMYGNVWLHFVDMKCMLVFGSFCWTAVFRHLVCLNDCNNQSIWFKERKQIWCIKKKKYGTCYFIEMNATERILLVRDFEKTWKLFYLWWDWITCSLVGVKVSFVFCVSSLVSFLHCMEAMSPIIHEKH